MIINENFYEKIFKKGYILEIKYGIIDAVQ